VPGLLQTSSYARALAEADPSLHDGVARDSAAEAVLARQHAILNKPGLELHLVIGEAALHQEVSSPEVMQKQLVMLAQAAGTARADRGFLDCAMRWLVFRDGMGFGPVGTPPHRSREERCG
jgi:hypothetical protein